MTYDDELDQNFIPIDSSELPPPTSPPPPDATREAIVRMLEEKPRLAQNPRRLYDEIRMTNHGISHEDICNVLAERNHDRRY